MKVYVPPQIWYAHLKKFGDRIARREWGPSP